MISYSDAILEDWRRWLYMDGFLRARELDHPALVTNMMGTLRWFVDHELYLQTGRFGGSKMPGMGGEGCPFDVDEAAREASALRASITVSGPYGDVPLDVQLAACVVGNYFRWMSRQPSARDAA